MRDVNLLEFMPVQLLETQFEDNEINRLELIDELYKLRESNPTGTLKRSNSGPNTWHSGQIIDNPKFSKLSDIIMDVVNEYIMKQYLPWHFAKGLEAEIDMLWAVINGRDSFNVLHDHAGGWLSGVLYLQHLGEEQGRIIFADPISSRRHAGPDYRYFIKEGNHIRSTETYLGKNGTLLVFPAWLYHKVDINNTDEDRISISFNISYPRVNVLKPNDLILNESEKNETT